MTQQHKDSGTDWTVAALREQERWSVENPSHDHPFLVKEALASMERGMSLQRAKIIYGQEVVEKATASQEKLPPAA